MPKQHKFDESFDVGKDGEKAIEKIVGPCGMLVIKPPRHYQSRGIDQIWCSDFSRAFYTVECKYDVRCADTGNIFLETMSDTSKMIENHNGWVYTTEAQLVATLIDGYLLIAEATKLKDNIKRLRDTYGEVSVQNVGYESEGVPVPLEEYKKLCRRVFDLRELKNDKRPILL